MDTKVQAYTEVNSFLKVISENEREKIPKKLRKVFEEKSSMEFEKQYNLNEPLYKQEISRQALAIIALLHINYWCKNEQEKNEVWNLLKQNEQKNEEEKRQKYDIENIFNNRHTKVINSNAEIETVQEQTDMIVYKESIFKRIINKIKNLFRK